MVEKLSEYVKKAVGKLLSMTNQVKEIIGTLDPDMQQCYACDEWVHMDDLKKVCMISERTFLLVCKDGCRTERGKRINPTEYYSVKIR